MSKANPEAVLYLRLSVAQDKLQQYPQALDSANKAVQYSPDGSAAQNLAKQQQARLQKLISARIALRRKPGAAAPASDSGAGCRSPADSSRVRRLQRRPRRTRQICEWRGLYLAKRAPSRA